MPLLVQKYGGKVVETPEQIKRIAQRLLALHESGQELIVVISAPGNLTDQLIQMAQEVASNPDRRELDALLAVGERMSSTRLVMAINQIAGKQAAVSFTGSQVGIITDENHGAAKILEVRGDRIREALKEKKIVVVAGFQGVSRQKEVTTLGRGGSDLTAVAIAASLGANRCELYKDVEGIFTADPHDVADARLLETLDYDELAALSRSGLKAVQTDAVELARDSRVPLAVGLAESGKIGTIVSHRAFSPTPITALTLRKQVELFSTDVDPLEQCIRLPGFPAAQLITPGRTWVLAPVDEALPIAAHFGSACHRETCDTIAVVGGGVYPGSPVCRELLVDLRDLCEALRLLWNLTGAMTVAVSGGVGSAVIKRWHRNAEENGWLPRGYRKGGS
ncbi:MAG: aspartate kinase [bacterium]|nr:aspartate kinase [bacterium]